MFGSVARVSRLVTARPSFSAMLFVVGVSLPLPTDSTRRVGHGGVLPLPVSEVIGDTPLTGRLDPILELRQDARAERGRVLYAAGRNPANRAAAAADRAKRTCRGDSTSRQVVQGRATGASPNS